MLETFFFSPRTPFPRYSTYSESILQMEDSVHVRSVRLFTDLFCMGDRDSALKGNPFLTDLFLLPLPLTQCSWRPAGSRLGGCGGTRAGELHSASLTTLRQILGERHTGLRLQIWEFEASV